MRQLVALIALVLVAPMASGAMPCRVLDPELSERYVGGCRDGLAHGLGVAVGTAHYRGRFSLGKKHGYGVKEWPSGDRYEGEFREDRKHGLGVYSWGAGSPWAGERFEGEYVEDRRHGHGVYLWPSGDRYDGVWTKDQRLGYSVMELRRQGAQRAVDKAVKVVGQQVCHRAKVGIAHSVQLRGTVLGFDEKGVRVALSGETGVVSGVLPNAAAGASEVFGPASLWYPCN